MAIVDEAVMERAAAPVRGVLAALSGAAGVLHLAMVPSHMDEWAAEGWAFALVGWGQLVMGLLVLVRLSRRLLQAVVASNVVFVGAWAVTRTAGPPFGPHAGHAESVSSVDLAAVGFEVGLVLLAGLILVRPALADRTWTGRGGRVSVALAAPVVVVAVATAVLVSPAARNHAHDSHGGHGDGDGAGHDGHDGHELAPVLQEDDRGLSQLRNGHRHESVEQELDAATRAELDEQLAVTREVAARYPTLADALADGFTRFGPYFPGLGAHYAAPRNPGQVDVMDREALVNPSVIIYDGTAPDSRIAGFMYLSLNEQEPEGFAGPNDVWHRHEQLCLKELPNGGSDIPFGLDHEATPQQCDAAGGEILPVGPWMVHVWSAPGYDDDPDVSTFHEIHTDLTCEDGTYYMLAPEQWVDHQHNVCRANPA